jgi:hypothetical protein
MEAGRNDDGRLRDAVGQEARLEVTAIDRIEAGLRDTEDHRPSYSGTRWQGARPLQSPTSRAGASAGRCALPGYGSSGPSRRWAVAHHRRSPAASPAQYPASSSGGGRPIPSRFRRPPGGLDGGRSTATAGLSPNFGGDKLRLALWGGRQHGPGSGGLVGRPTPTGPRLRELRPSPGWTPASRPGGPQPWPPDRPGARPRRRFLDLCPRKSTERRCGHPHPRFAPR